MIASHDEIAFDSKYLVWCWNPEHPPGRQLYLDDLQWNPPDELPDARINVAQLAKDYLAGCDPVGHPAVGGFNGIQYGIEASIKICQHVVMIKRRAVVSPQRRRRTSYQHRIRDDVLKASCCLEHANQFSALEASRLLADPILALA